jgi:glyoxylase-like metal-dependent hydrolase (beta-lactamase superfamily II)
MMNDAKLIAISEHVYWMPPGEPDRPSLCAVVGSDYTLMLDAGASDAHARLFLDQMAAQGLRAPQIVALTHWHWDHVFGAAALDIPVIAHEDTARQLVLLASYDWSNAAIDQRLASGEEIEMCAHDIKLELPEPRTVRIAQPALTFAAAINIRLGGVSCRIEHIGGDHAADSSVMYILPDRVLFLGDCLYDAIYAPKRHYTKQRLENLLKSIRYLDADSYVWGHDPEVMTREQFADLTDKLSLALRLIKAHEGDEASIVVPQPDPYDLVATFVGLLLAGREFE